MKRWIKLLPWAAVASLAAFALVRAFRGSPVLVELASVGRGELLVTVDDDGRTRVRERYTVDAPFDGWLWRTPLDAGAAVRAGETVVAELEPIPSAPLDERSRREAGARVERAAAALDEARAAEARAAAELAYARTDRRRQEGLRGTGSLAERELDRSLRDERVAEQSLDAARAAVASAEAELALARAGLAEPALLERPADGESAPAEAPQERLFALRSPVDGRVLRVLEESAGRVAAGTPLVELGDPAALEVVADLLSQDAVLVRAGMEVLVEGWRSERQGEPEETLHGRVRLVEPSGFTKVSALGVEEQRVDVLIDPAEPLAPWQRLADGYRVEVRVVLWRGDDVLLVPTGALFHDGEEWAVFVVEEDRAHRRAVTLGHRGGLEAEVRGGLEEGERVVLYPSALLEDGARVSAR